MPEPINVRFRGFGGIDYSTAAPARLPRGKPPMVGEQTLLEGAISALAATGNNTGRLLDSTRTKAAQGAPIIYSGQIPGATMPWSRDWTVTDGLTAGGGAGMAISGGAGIYFWKKPVGYELGLYGSASYGLLTNIGVSAGIQVALLFGPAPSVLAGDSITVSVSVDMVVASVAGSLILSAPPGGVIPPAGTPMSAWLAALPYTPTIVGVAFTLSAGISLLPVDYSIMPGRTWTTALVTR